MNKLYGGEAEHQKITKYSQLSYKQNQNPFYAWWLSMDLVKFAQLHLDLYGRQNGSP